MKLKKKRKWHAVFSLCLLMLVSILCASCTSQSAAITIPVVNNGVYIYDEDDIIDNETEKYLNSLLTKLEKATSAEVVVVSVESLQGMDIEDYSYKLANSLKIGKADEDNGVLLLISRSDNRVRLEIGKGLEGCLNDSKCGRILDNYFVPYREEDKYSEATRYTIEAIISVIADEYNVTIDRIERNYTEEIEKSEQETKNVGKVLIFILIVFLIILIVCSDIDGGSSGASYSSGGGISSGGGFGGGSFGGGGASR